MSRALSGALAHGAALGLCMALLVVAGQPIFSDDVWWHLGLGRAFAASGPWLAEDPLLFDAAAPPSPAAWLFDVGLHAVHSATGFYGLRALHVALVAGLLGLAWSLLRRASGSALVASAGTAVFVALSAYRLVQLRPHLLTIGLLLIVYRLLLEDPRAPGPRRVAAACLLFAFWANVHAAFPLGLLVLGAASAAAWCDADPAARLRARRLSVATAVCAAATLLNPRGVGALLPWFAAGHSTPSLGRVLDEWAPVDLFAWPQPALPPTPLAWMLAWALVLCCLGLAPRVVERLRGRALPHTPIDIAQLGAAAIALPVSLFAVRFLWLAMLPLALLARALGPRVGGSPRAAWIATAIAVLVAAGFPRLGAWPMISRGLRHAEAYALPYASHKYHPEPVFLLRDAGVEGRLYCDYFLAGFVGFWLAPRVRTLVNGTLNVSPETLRAAAALEARRGLAEGETFTELLDRLGVDLFLGIRAPETGNPWRPWKATTAHLEGTPGWIPLFRNLHSAVYLRDVPHDRTNLERVATHYADIGIPFDPERGFDPLRVVRDAPGWAAAQGLVPAGFARLEHRAHNGRGAGAIAARLRLAGLYTALGAHEEALALDRETLERRADALGAQRRVVWNLLRLGRHAEAARATGPLDARPPEDWLSRDIAEAAREVEGLAPGEARARIAALPVFYRAELPGLLAGVPWPAAPTE